MTTIVFPNSLPVTQDNYAIFSLWDTIGQRFAAWQAGTVTLDGGVRPVAPALIQPANGSAIFAYGSPDAGVTAKYLKTDSSGILSAAASLNAGSNLVGGAMTYREMVGRSLAGTRKVLSGNVAVPNSGGSAATISIVDETGTAYSSVTSGKTLLISTIIVSIDLGPSSALQTALFTLASSSGGANLLAQALVSSYGVAVLTFLQPIPLTSTVALTVKCGVSNLAAAGGKMYVSMIAEEE